MISRTFVNICEVFVNRKYKKYRNPHEILKPCGGKLSKNDFADVIEK